MMKNPPSTNEEREFIYWNRVYLAVIIFTAIIILALWLFSRAFQ